MDNFSTLVDLLIKDEVAGRPSHERVLHLGSTPSYLVEKAGFPNLELVVTGKVISKAAFDHGISTSLLKRLDQVINNPKELYNSANIQMTDSVVVMTFEMKGSLPIIIPVRKERKIGRSGVFNTVTSVYGKEGPDPSSKWQKQGLLIHDFT